MTQITERLRLLWTHAYEPLHREHVLSRLPINQWVQENREYIDKVILENLAENNGWVGS